MLMKKLFYRLAVCPCVIGGLVGCSKDDEPGGGVKELQEKLGLSYLFISHDLDVVRWFCDEIAVMEEGKFVETGRTEDVIGHPKTEFTKKLVENFILE